MVRRSREARPRAVRPNATGCGDPGSDESGLGFPKAALATLVAIVSVVEEAAPPVGVILDGEKLQVVNAGRPLHVKLTAEEKPPTGVTEIVALPLCPLAMVS